jgi:hypothetical protein
VVHVVAPARGTRSVSAGQVAFAGPWRGTNSNVHTRAPVAASNAMRRPVTA